MASRAQAIAFGACSGLGKFGGYGAHTLVVVTIFPVVVSSTAGLNGAHYANDLPVWAGPSLRLTFRSDFDFTDVGFWRGDLNSDRACVLHLGERCSLLEISAGEIIELLRRDKADRLRM